MLETGKIQNKWLSYLLIVIKYFNEGKFSYKGSKPIKLKLPPIKDVFQVANRKGCSDMANPGSNPVPSTGRNDH